MFWHRKRNRLGPAGAPEESAVWSVRRGEECPGDEAQTAQTAPYQTEELPLCAGVVSPVLKYSVLCCPSRLGWLPEHERRKFWREAKRQAAIDPALFCSFLGIAELQHATIAYKC